MAKPPDVGLRSRILELINALVRERQRLRAAHESTALLEGNRLAIGYWQQQLARGVRTGGRGGLHGLESFGAVTAPRSTES